jgi:NAD(P)-dependent dehydrogenase (short-subunit alcohol dehydrogenase family)
MSTNQKVWFITGVSSGLGRELAEKALAHGDCVVGTLRQLDQFAAFAGLAPGRALPVHADVTDESSVRAAVKKAVDTFGRIDILANNAGWGMVGAVEETSNAEAHDIFESNFFGQLNVTRAVLPTMRTQKSGYILSFSAIGGFGGVAGLGVYAAAKAAVDVYSEALAQEVAPFGIKVTVLTLGIFRTKFASSSLKQTHTVIDDYAETPAGKFRNFIRHLPGNQPNDPAKAADAILQLVNSDRHPMHLALGKDALGSMRNKIEGLTSDLNCWEVLSKSTAYDA